jgi:hypothetical protein
MMTSSGIGGSRTAPARRDRIDQAMRVKLFKLGKPLF